MLIFCIFCQEMCDKTNCGRKSTALQVLVDSERKRRRGRADIHLHDRGKVLADLGSPISSREANVRMDAKGTEPWQGLNQSSSTTTTKIKCGRTTWIFFSQANSYFAEFFVEQCRRNSNKFSDRSEEEKYLIYNYSPTFSSREKVNYVLTEVYLFDKDGNSVQEWSWSLDNVINNLLLDPSQHM